MKKPSNNCILLIVIVIVSGVDCNILTTIIEENPQFRMICKRLNDNCYEDKECCSLNCKRSFYFFRGYCDMDKTILSSAKYMVPPQIIHDFCSYHKQNDNAIKDRIHRQFYISAAHSILPPNTKILVSTKYRQVVVTINDLPAKTNNTLELSDEAALQLGITQEGIIPCDVEVLVSENIILVLDVSCDSENVTAQIEDNPKPPEVCKNLNEDCYESNECCSQYCQQTLKNFRGYCELDKTTLASIGNITMGPRIFPDHCFFYKQNNSLIKESLFKRFDLNAAHSVLLPRTRVLVSSLHREVVVTISDLPATTNDTLELSEEAALQLGVTEEGTIPCSLEILLPTPSPISYMKNIIFFAPLFAFTFGLWIYHI
ncbi:RlpA-like protein, double-psi beta-barrel domain [Cinara cedri]|uniref:RlpA-like protein, double-psi beta-barrel domain n=1 Tax=Cinara cedri TaxID=506608 RepID=A0A5E4MLY7_9HEMI|nr:RlpA-like protein, double-psi beta-barrel domain [Cinara cedri]